MNTMSDSATRLQPRPTAGPVHGGHDRHPAGHHPGDDAPTVDERLLAEGIVRRDLVDVVEVAPGREGPAVAGEHRRPGLEVGVDLGPQLGQALVEHVVGGVELIGAVQADDADRSVDLDLDLGGQVVAL